MAEIEAAGERPCWLMKTEPDVYSIDEFQKEKVAIWEGVRNFQARNFMRYEMKKGDKVLFYHSNAKPPGVVGLATVHTESLVDPYQFDKKSKYFDASSKKEKPKWYCVEIKYKKKLKNMVSLGAIKNHAPLASMLVGQRGMRLSVQPVSQQEYEEILALAEQNQESV